MNAGHIFRGQLYVSQHNSAEAFVQIYGNSPFDRDVFIRGQAPRNRAIHGDIVAVEVRCFCFSINSNILDRFWIEDYGELLLELSRHKQKLKKGIQKKMREN